MSIVPRHPHETWPQAIARTWPYQLDRAYERLCMACRYRRHDSAMHPCDNPIAPLTREGDDCPYYTPQPAAPLAAVPTEASHGAE